MIHAYDPDLITAVAHVLRCNRDEDFYIFRNPDDPIPPLREHPNAIHKVSRHVGRGRLFVFDAIEYSLTQRLERAV